MHDVAPSAELLELMAAATSRPVPAMPPPAPAPGQSREDWVRDVQQIRHEHERWAAKTAAEFAGDQPAPVTASAGDVRDVAIGPLRVRVFTPAGDGPFPLLMSFHGGGFWIGGADAGLDAADGSCRLMCQQLGAVVVHVDYRQAPEHRFPVPLEDCYAATCWATEHAAELQVDPTRLVLCGPSAGANLAAGVALLLRDRGGPRVRGMVLMVPCSDATFTSPSIAENGDGRFDITKEYVAAAWDLYLGPDGDRREPLASLLHHPDLSGLPPTHVVVGEFDALRDDGLRLADRLREAAVEVSLSRFPMGHGVVTPDVGEQYLRDVLGRLGAALSS